MKASKNTKRRRHPPPRNHAKNRETRDSASHVNTGAINTYGHWVSEMSRIIRESKGRS
jgi:hypothetical protein